MSKINGKDRNRHVRLQVPATSANLGCGFDTLGMSWNWKNTWEVTVSDRAAAYSLLSNDPSLCLIAPPMPSFLAAQYGLVQRPTASGTVYRDLLICRKDYRLTDTDEAFLRALKGTARAVKE